MNDAEYEREVARIAPLLEEWIHRLRLDDWDIKIEYFRGAIPNQDEDTYAVTGANWEYMQAKIGFNCSTVVDEDDAKIEQIVVHELMHVMTNELRVRNDEGPDSERALHEERVCTMLAKGFLTAAKMTPAKPAKAKN